MSDNPHSLVLSLHTEIDKLIAELEKVCFEPKADTTSTRDARVRRLQLLDIRDFLLQKNGKVELTH